MAKFGFDVDEVEVDIAPDYSPIPKGEYKLQALEAEEKETSKKNGSYIKVKFEVVDGPHMSRLIWQNFNIVNPNETAQRIGRQQLVAWATACGKPVDIDKGTGGYSDSNTIKGFLQSKAQKKVEKVSAPAAVEAPVAPAAKSGSNPWD